MGRVDKQLFIFDLDGTLVDAYEAITQSLNYTRKTLGYTSVSMYKVKRSVGRGDRVFIESFFNPQDVEKALDLYRKHHKKALLRHTCLMPYAKWLLSCLKQKRKRIAIASNRPTPFTRIILNRLSIKKYIDYVLCADKLKHIKPHPEILEHICKKFKIIKPKVVYIGDMDIDLETGLRAKIDTVFVKGGSSTLREAKAYSNVKIISNLGELLKLYG